MFERLLHNTDGLPRRRRHKGIGRWYRIRLTDDLCVELEQAARQRHLTAEVLLTTIDQVILREHLVDAILDDRNE